MSPLCAPSAAAINCNSFCGSLSHALNSGPSVCAAIWAAMLTSPVKGSAATNFTSLILIVLPGRPTPNASLICLATSCALEPAIVNAAHQPHEIFFGDVFGEMQAGESGGAQQGGKTFFGLP